MMVEPLRLFHPTPQKLRRVDEAERIHQYIPFYKDIASRQVIC